MYVFTSNCLTAVSGWTIVGQELQLKIDEHSATVEELQFEIATQTEKMKLYESQVHAAEVSEWQHVQHARNKWGAAFFARRRCGSSISLHPSVHVNMTHDSPQVTDGALTMDVRCTYVFPLRGWASACAGTRTPTEGGGDRE